MGSARLCPSDRLRPSDLLHYNAKHRVLICKSCQYGIQPSAISRHLKDRHQIYRSQRRKFCTYTQQFDLVEPRNVIPPVRTEPPTPFLLIEEGQLCGSNDCDHLCVTVKRMKNHWLKDHSGREPSWVPVTLQTFFRGNQLRYFVVTPSLRVGNTAQVNALLSKSLKVNEEKWSIQDKGLLHHFQEHTSLTLGYDSETRHLWQVVIPKMSCHYPFLRHSILALSAIHLSRINPEAQCIGYEIAFEHQEQALREYRRLIATPNEDNCHALLAVSKLLVFYLTALVALAPEGPATQWIRQVGDSYARLKAVWKHLEEGPLAQLIPEGINGERMTPAERDTTSNQPLTLLLDLPFFGAKSLMDKVNGGMVLTFPSTYMELARAYQIVRVARERGRYALWTAVCIWPARISANFLDQLEASDPSSLVMFTYFLVLMKQLTSEWYIRGFVDKMLAKVNEALDPDYRQWIEWPLCFPSQVMDHTEQSKVLC